MRPQREACRPHLAFDGSESGEEAIRRAKRRLESLESGRCFSNVSSDVQIFAAVHISAAEYVGMH